MRDRILQSIFRAVDELNLQRPKQERLAKSEDADLTVLDSLGTANLVVLIEQEVDNEFHASVNLLEEGSLLDGQRKSLTVRDLAEIVERILEQGKDD